MENNNPEKEEKKCKQCILEGNTGICDRKDCSNFSQEPMECGVVKLGGEYPYCCGLHRKEYINKQEPIEWESELRKEFHSFSVKMAQDVEERLLNYSEVEGMIVNFWLSQIKQAEERARQQDIKVVWNEVCEKIQKEEREKIFKELATIKRWVKTFWDRETGKEEDEYVIRDEDLQSIITNQ